MENLFNWLKVDWEFSLAVPGVWSTLYYPALVLIAFFNAVSLYCFARILVHNAGNNHKVIRLAICLLLASMAYGVGTPILAINAPVTVRNIIGSFGMALFMCCLTSGRFQIDLRPGGGSGGEKRQSQNGRKPVSGRTVVPARAAQGRVGG